MPGPKRIIYKQISTIQSRYVLSLLLSASLSFNQRLASAMSVSRQSLGPSTTLTLPMIEIRLKNQAPKCSSRLYSRQWCGIFVRYFQNTQYSNICMWRIDRHMMYLCKNVLIHQHNLTYSFAWSLAHHALDKWHCVVRFLECLSDQDGHPSAKYSECKTKSGWEVHTMFTVTQKWRKHEEQMKKVWDANPSPLAKFADMLLYCTILNLFLLANPLPYSIYIL